MENWHEPWNLYGICWISVGFFEKNAPKIEVGKCSVDFLGLKNGDPREEYMDTVWYCSQEKDMSEGMWADMASQPLILSMSLLYTSLKERPAHAEEGPRLFRFATCWGCSTPTMTRSSPSCIFENITNWTWTVLAPSNKKVNLQKLENQG